MSRTTPPAAPPPGPVPAAPPRRVLVVEDDPTVAEVVTGYLTRAGYLTEHVTDGWAALDRAASFRPHLVVLDLMLPGLDGLEVCRRLRGAHTAAPGPAPAPVPTPVPVVMLTARGEAPDRILGLELGADDYVTKPFSPRELVLRIGSVLRRAEAAPPAATPVPPVRAGDLTADPAARHAVRAGRPLSLTTREFDLLLFLMGNPGRVFAREDLLHQVWGWEFGDLSTVTVHVRRLREKIEDDPAAPRLIVTVWGAGYRFDPAGGMDDDGAAPDAPPAPAETPRP
ncbi:DNA-binding response regulator [Streptomyces albofaciens JCM 4342]|uniref:response regulator transcription factor n=1 Tax=Streptomyces albofaciens TaxID=66866 RepID=UPI0012386BAD|nr:response regulator transcription factor [Streptomyces albofaciens]KAA6222812.1 DNA-binding response regulator [Streptomyces albofaciens JCM 4342]